MLAHVFCGGTHDTSVIELVLHIVSDPAGNTGDRKQGGEQVFGDAEHMVCETGIEVYICRKDFFLPHIGDVSYFLLKCLIEQELVHAALLLGKFPAERAEQFRSRIREGVDGVAEAVDQAAVVIHFFVKQVIDDLADELNIHRIMGALDDFFHHL